MQSSALYLRNCNLKRLTAHFDELTGLRYLDLSSNNFSYSAVLGQDVDTLKNVKSLQNLYLNSCQIVNLPNNFSDLSIQNLFISGNPLNPSGCLELGYMPALVNLTVQSDGLTDLPSSLTSLTTLQTLDASDNKLFPVPDIIKNIPNLKDRLSITASLHCQVGFGLEQYE